MSNVFANLPAIINAVGATVDTSSFAGERTLTVSGPFGGQLVVEVSVDGGTTFAALVTFKAPGERTVEVAATHMRVRSHGAAGTFTPNIDVASDEVGIRSAVIPVPAINAAGASLDISAFGSLSTFIAGGVFNGVLLVEISEDGTGWIELTRFTKPGTLVTRTMIANEVRLRSVGASGTFTPSVSVGASNDALPAVPAESFAITGRDDGVTFNVFVDSINGSDTNDGLTAGTALFTIDEVRRKFPFYLFGQDTKCIVNLIGASAPIAVTQYATMSVHLGGGGIATDQSYFYRGPQMMLAPLASGPTAPAQDAAPTRVDATGAISGTGRRTRFNFVAAAPGWTVGDLVGSFMQATRGADLVTFEFPIAENGIDFFIIDSHVESTQILGTDTITIVTPAVEILGYPNADGENILTLDGKGVGFSQEIYGAPNDNNQPNTFERVAFNTLECTGIYGLTFDRCRFVGQFGARFVGGSVVFNNCGSNGEIQLGCVNGFQNFMRADAPGVSPIFGDFAQSGHINITVATRTGGFGTNGISVGRVRATQVLPPTAYLFERNVSCYGSTNSAVNVYAGSCCAFAIGVLGANNSVVGVRAHQNSTAYFYTSAVNVPLRITATGTAGDLRVANGAAIAYGVGAGQFYEVIGYNGNFTRKNEGTAAAPLGDASLIANDPTGGV